MANSPEVDEPTREYPAVREGPEPISPAEPAAAQPRISGFARVLIFMGVRIDQEKPPIPATVASEGRTIMTQEDIIDGQQIWQSIGGQEVGHTCAGGIAI